MIRLLLFISFVLGYYFIKFMMKSHLYLIIKKGGELFFEVDDFVVNNRNEINKKRPDT